MTTARDPRCGAVASMAAGSVLLGWIVGGELLLALPDRTTTDRVTDAVYLAAGSLMLILGVALRRDTQRA